MTSNFVIFLFAILCAGAVVLGLPTPEEESAEHVATRAACVLPMEMGVCRARMSRWGYVPSQKQCVSFFYGGCLGNANNFHTKEECVQVCEGV